MNSLPIKGLTVGLVAALVAVVAIEGRIEFAHVAVFPVVPLLGLDEYFLCHERRSRSPLTFEVEANLRSATRRHRAKQSSKRK